MNDKIRLPGSPQIGCHLNDEERLRVERHAERYGLVPATLLGLLVRREVAQKRLENLKFVHSFHRTKKDGRRVTTHVSKKLKDSFVKHIQDVGIMSDRAAGILLIADLSEKWLDQCFLQVGISLDSNSI